MGKMVQIRNMPDKMHRTLKVRAAHAGLSLSDYLMRELRKSTEAPTREELVERLRGLSPVKTKEESADIIRRLRDADDSRRAQ